MVSKGEGGWKTVGRFDQDINTGFLFYRCLQSSGRKTYTSTNSSARGIGIIGVCPEYVYLWKSFSQHSSQGYLGLNSLCGEQRDKFMLWVVMLHLVLIDAITDICYHQLVLNCTPGVNSSLQLFSSIPERDWAAKPHSITPVTLTLICKNGGKYIIMPTPSRIVLVQILSETSVKGTCNIRGGEGLSSTTAVFKLKFSSERKN